ncbi:MAG: chromosome segregation protein [Flavobacteriaceae bacterium]|nr:MAG: chromosome segregation protein [Flavobacteriaceae bacterium]
MLDEKNNDMSTAKVEETTAMTNQEVKADAEKVTVDTVENVKKVDVETDVTKVVETIDDAEIVAVDEQQESVAEIADVESSEKVVAAHVTAIDEIEKKVAESSEVIEQIEQLEMLDYKSMELEQLVAELTVLVKEKPVLLIKNNVNEIKTAFNKKFGDILSAEKERFLSEGGNEIDFNYANPLKTTYNGLLYDYKVSRDAHYSSVEKELNTNLASRNQVIEELKHLIENADGNTMYKNFRSLQDTWRAIGPVPKATYNDTWKTYHHHVERFYDLLHLNNDLRDLDFKHNLEEKLKLVNKAEELAEHADINFAFKELQVIHKLWKEEVGPVGREHREEVWNRFSAATKKVHDKRHEHFKELRSGYEANVAKKLAVIEEIDAYETTNNRSRSDWQKSIKEIEALRDKFFKCGTVPRSKNEEVWQLFKVATHKFNKAKNSYYKDVKDEQLTNLKKKQALVAQAIALKESDDWENTTNMMKKIQSDWKKVGHVPRKYSDKLWKEFKDACNHYFDQLHQVQDADSKEELGFYEAKKSMLDAIKKAIEEKADINLETIDGYISEWRGLGRVPSDKKYIEGKFNKVIESAAESLDLDKDAVEMLKFKNVIASYIEQKNYRKLDSEQLYVRKKIDECMKEVQQLENNLGFFSNAKDDNPLVINVRKNIEQYKSNAQIWKSKLAYLRTLSYS